jgi:FXSXX-COOH protein
MDEVEPDLEADLIDLTGIDLDKLNDLPASVLADSLRRIRQEALETSEQPYAGFLSSI